VSTTELVVARWRANAAAAGIELPDEVVARAVDGGTTAQVMAFEALLRRLSPGFTMPDELTHPLDEEPIDA